MPTFIRLTEYRDSDSKEAGFFDPRNRHTANQDNFAKISGSPVAYWVKNSIIDIFHNGVELDSLASPRKGVTTSDDNYFSKYWYEVENKKIGFGYLSNENFSISGLKWSPLNRGGEIRKWYGNLDSVINWENDGFEIKNFKDEKGKLRSRPQNINYHFSQGISWNYVSSNNFACRLVPQGIISNASGPMIYDFDYNNYLMAYLMSPIGKEIFKILCPTLMFEVGQIQKVPIKTNFEMRNQQIDSLVTQNIIISKEEWDSRETSWDFCLNELIHHKTENSKIESAFAVYCVYWREKFHQLHTNEEELNRLFIEIYGLEEELTPDVALDDITILKSESKIEDDELVFNADEIARQFISYAVGCMFGRYSLDREGLVVANMGQAIPTDTSFEIDDDNIIPVLEEEVFSDDIVARFERFVAVAFGEEFVGENIRWIEQSVGMDIRKYFVSEFYKDHVRRYKKRPIYWMVQSPKKGFSALIYMHRYQSDTMARVQTMYLREYLTKIDSLIEHTRSVSNNPDSSAKDAKEAGKTLTKLEAKQRDALDFDRGDMSRIAALQIAIDLDDGVKVNYQKFKGVLPDIGLSKGDD